MSIIRVVHNKENPFVQLNKAALWNPNLSLKAVGLWARCMSRPDDWRFNIKELAAKSKEGRRAIDGAINELIEANYAMRVEHFEKEENGKFCGGRVEYIFFEFPASQEEKTKYREEFKKSFRRCGFGDCRNGDCRNSNLLISNPTEIEKDTNIENTSEPKKEKTGPSAEASVLADEFHKILKNAFGKDFKTPNIHKWATDFDRMLKIDQRDPMVIRKIMNWVVNDSFWRKNILSPTKLRQHFLTLLLGMEKPLSALYTRTTRTKKEEPQWQRKQTEMHAEIDMLKLASVKSD